MNFYITLDYLLKNSLIHGNVSREKLVVILRKVQSIRMEDILGTTLQDDLLEKIGSGTITGNDKILVDKYIVPCLIGYCEVMAAKYYNIEIRNKSVGKSNDQYQTANNSKDSDLFVSELKRDANVAKNKLIGYLCENMTLFPEYKKYCDSKAVINPSSQSDSYDDTMMFVSVNG